MVPPPAARATVRDSAPDGSMPWSHHWVEVFVTTMSNHLSIDM